ncbi:MAG: hypothetical protein HY541_04965 [Deltaproteobacteria bacterium]|nr:hypothetical protein [Deltaproteobacteria bacterium]
MKSDEAPSGDSAGEETDTGEITDTGDSTPSGEGEETAAAGSMNIVYDFTTSIPEGITSSGCVIAGGALVLPKNADGTYREECYIDVALGSKVSVPIMATVDATRVNSLSHGDFESVTANQINLESSLNQSMLSSLVSSQWIADASGSSYKPSIVDDGSGNHAAVLTKRGSLYQYFKILPGEGFRFMVDLNGSNLGERSGIDQLFYLSLQFFDKNFSRLNFLNPVADSTVSELSNFKNYSSTDDRLTVDVLLHTIDCQDHVKYKKEDGTHGADVFFNHCKQPGGSAQTTSAGNTYLEEDITYGAVELKLNWQGDGTASIDDISVDYLNQIQMAVISNNAVVARSWPGEHDLYIENPSAEVTLRLYLRTLVPAQTPTVKSLSLSSGETHKVQVGNMLAAFAEPRIGFTGIIPPTQEWYDAPTVRSECLDPFEGNASLGCWDFLTKYGVGRWRTNIPLNNFNTTLNDGTYSLPFHEGNYSNKVEPRTFLPHLAQASEAGMEILMIIDGACDGTYWFGSQSYDCFWDGTSGELKSAFDPTPSDNTDDANQSIELMRQVAKRFVSLFNGNQTYVFSDGSTVKLPPIGRWELGVETNIAEPEWYTLLSDEDEAAYLSGIAKTIRQEDTDAHVETSLNPNNSTIHQTFDYDYIESILSKAEAENYTHFNFNTFNNGTDIQPEEWLVDWPLLKEQSYFGSWKDKTLAVGAYDYARTKYDPDCSDKWERGFGDQRYAKLLARATLVALSLPAEEIYDYIFFGGEGWAGGNLSYEPCWKAEWDSGTIFERVVDTGVLAGKDEPSQYELNSGGLALITIAKYISSSSPFETTVEDGGSLYATYFESSGGSRYFALWQGYDDQYGADYMGYVSGQADHGYEAGRLVNITLDGAGSFSRATRIPLDGTALESLAVTNGLIQKILLEGDMPVLIKLE